MSWWVILALAAGAYGFKVAGLVLLGGRPLPPAVDRCLALLPAALLSAIVVVQTFAAPGRELVIDARVVGLAVAIVATWRRAPFWLVVTAASASTALVRALG
jgi:branched-subunit amino acid transport protein